MHMENGNDPFKDLLSRYSAPFNDDGFSQRVIDAAAQQTPNPQTSPALRTGFIGAAALIGGGFAALQIPAFISMVSAISLPGLPAAHMPEAELNLPVYAAGALLLAALGWFSAAALLDEKF